MTVPMHPRAEPRRTPDGAGPALSGLARGRRVGGRTVVVCAHPDDETLGLGGVLHLFAGLELVQVTDGAPASPADQRAAGCASRRQYAALREAEARAALQALGLDPPRTRLGLTDQGAVEALAPLARLLAERLAGAERVITHAYEGGHPDHDAAAFAVQAACALIARTGGTAPSRLEFAGYHEAGGERVAGRFWPDPRHAEVAVALAPAALARKTGALAAYASQAAVVDWFPVATERFRTAPDYDFRRPPPPRAALYDRFGWTLTSAAWRAEAAAAQELLFGEGARAWA